MTREETKTLMREIADLYPKFQATPNTVDTWAGRLGEKSLEWCEKQLDKWLAGDKGDYAPNLRTFLAKDIKTENTFIDYSERHYKVEFFDDLTKPVGITSAGKRVYEKLPYGILVDEEGYEFGNPEGEYYYYNKMGNICRRSNGEEIVVVR